MKRAIAVIISSVYLIFLSCDEKIVLVKCADCTENEPVETSLEVSFSENIGGVHVTAMIRIYEGNIEDSILLGVYTANYSPFEHSVPLNKKYTLSATYFKGQATYIAIDSATPRVRYESKKCDNPCYFVYDKTINLRLKYTK